jgi:hypothetical protein
MEDLVERIRQARRLVRLETIAGPEWTDGGTTVTPVARSLTVGSSFRYSRPSEVIVSVDGSAYRMPIIDVTRWAQLAIVLVALLVLWEVWARTNTRKERS